MSCLQSHAQAKLKEKCYPVPCPQPNCTTGISNRECNMILRNNHDRQLLAEVGIAFKFCLLVKTLYSTRTFHAACAT